MGGNARCLGGTGGRVGPKLENCHFPGKSGAIGPILPWKVRTLTYTFLTQITVPFI